MESHETDKYTLNRSKQKQNTPKKKFLQCRYIVGMMGFLTYAVLNIQSISTSVAIVAMVNNSLIQPENQSVSCASNIKTDTQDLEPNSNVEFDWSPEHQGYILGALNFGYVAANLPGGLLAFFVFDKTQPNGEFDWSPELQGYILGASNFGFVVSQLPGGLLAQTFGGKLVIASGLLLASICYFISPFIARTNAYLLIAAQVLRGIGQGLQPASSFVLVANWFPRQERGGIMTIIIAGVCVGGIVGGVSAGAMCAGTLFGGWPSVYYIFGGVGLILALGYIMFIYESPKYDPRVSHSERTYILDNQETDLSKKRPSTPWCKILTSVPIYASSAADFGYFWMTSHFTTVHPTFLGTILHFTIEENGLFSSVPFALQAVIAFLSCWVSEWLLRNKYASLNKVRKGFTLLSVLSYSLCVFGIYLARCDKTLSTVFSMLAIGSGGFGNAGSLINSLDLSPNFAGSIIGLSSIVSCSAFYIVPVVVGNLTKFEQSLEQWNKMFFISIAVTMLSGIIFCVFGSAEVQPWNFPPDDLIESEKNRKRKECDYDNYNFQHDSTTHL